MGASVTAQAKQDELEHSRPLWISETHVDARETDAGAALDGAVARVNDPVAGTSSTANQYRVERVRLRARP